MKNPYAPTHYLLPLLPTVGATCWRELSDGLAHPLVVEAAARLLALPRSSENVG